MNIRKVTYTDQNGNANIGILHEWLSGPEMAAHGLIETTAGVMIEVRATDIKIVKQKETESLGFPICDPESSAFPHYGPNGEYHAGMTKREYCNFSNLQDLLEMHLPDQAAPATHVATEFFFSFINSVGREEPLISDFEPMIKDVHLMLKTFCDSMSNRMESRDRAKQSSGSMTECAKMKERMEYADGSMPDTSGIKNANQSK